MNGNGLVYILEGLMGKAGTDVQVGEGRSGDGEWREKGVTAGQEGNSDRSLMPLVVETREIR